jgi:pyridoxine 5-phosphate synthase
MTAHTLLSVNVNKIATLRNSRGAAEPSVVRAAACAIDAGAGGITVHPRPDTRHITPQDVIELAALCRARGVEFNIEGNPFAPANARYPGLLALIAQSRPQQVTLVPDSDAQLTSDHGFNLVQASETLKEVSKDIRALGARVSVFVDPDCASAGLQAARRIGIDRIEIYTQAFAERAAQGDPSAANQCADLARRAVAQSLGVNAGHDLSQANLAQLLRAAPAIQEVSIGHALISEALYDGLHNTVQNYLRIIASVRTS